MSSIREHTVQGLVTSAALYPFIGAEHTAAFGLSVIFIDIDHVLEYIRQTKSFNIFGVFPYSKVLLNTMKKNNFLVLNIFHTVEFFLLIALLGLLNPVFFYMLAGMLYHLALDIYHLSKSDIASLRAFSVIEFFIRARNNKYITSFAKLLQRDTIDLSGVKQSNFWLRHWKNTAARSGRLNNPLAY